MAIVYIQLYGVHVTVSINMRDVHEHCIKNYSSLSPVLKSADIGWRKNTQYSIQGTYIQCTINTWFETHGLINLRPSYTINKLGFCYCAYIHTMSRQRLTRGSTSIVSYGELYTVGHGRLLIFASAIFLLKSRQLTSAFTSALPNAEVTREGCVLDPCIP